MDKQRVDLFKSKLGFICTVPLDNNDDLSRAYTPGVAQPCLKIKSNKDLSFAYTCRGNMVAVISDGSRVLGLGNIGPEAAMPVMEGKSVLFKAFGNVDAVPLCIAEQDPQKIISIIKSLEPSFAGINLEDFSSPKCYEIENVLQQQMNIPVFHDDQHGTAIACCSALMSALRFVKKDIASVKIVVSGAGSAGTSIASLLLELGAGRIMLCNSKGTIYSGQPGLNDVQENLAQKIGTKKQLSFAQAAERADVLLGVSAPKLFTAEILKNLNGDAIVFSMANPVPECSYEEAKAAGVRVAGTGRSDAPNQINNVKVFPGIFRGALDVRAKAITMPMKIAAVRALDGLIGDSELAEDYVTPDAFDPRVAAAVAAAVAQTAMDTGAARISVDPEEIYKKTRAVRE